MMVVDPINRYANIFLWILTGFTSRCYKNLIMLIPRDLNGVIFEFLPYFLRQLIFSHLGPKNLLIFGTNFRRIDVEILISFGLIAWIEGLFIVLAITNFVQTIHILSFSTSFLILCVYFVILVEFYRSNCFFRIFLIQTQSRYLFLQSQKLY